MNGFNTYIDQLDYSEVIDFFLRKGKKCLFKRKDFFIHQYDISLYIAYVEKGAFRYTCINKDGKEIIVGYSFEKEFICDYSSFLKRGSSLVNIQATTAASVYVISLNDYLELLASGVKEPNYRHKVAEALFDFVYSRLLELYCATPEQRYIELMQRCPDLKEKVPLKEIASFLGVTPETVSHIRKKILNPKKS